jgi:hypothetical protein
MKNLLEKVRSFFSSLASKLKRKPKAEPAPQAESVPSAGRKPDRFTLISWAITIVIVVALLTSTIIYKNTVAASSIGDPQATSEPGITPPLSGGPVAGTEGTGPYILRDLQLKTNIPERPRYESLIYRVSRGDAMLSIADEFDLESESILYVNTDLEDNPHNLKPGMELLIPPVDGIYHEWEEGDTFESVAEEFFAEPAEIINFPGNEIDLTDPQVQVGTTIMIPGGSRELRNWAADLPTQGRGADTGTGEIQGNVCGGGPVASGFGWPAGSHAISGNGYGPGHLGIDIQANEGEPVT